MSRALVLGLGNRLSGADAFGPAVLDHLQQSALPPNADLVEAGTDLLALIDRFTAYETIVLVDAVIGADGRRVAVVPEEIFTKWYDRSLSAHELSAVGCVQLFRTLQAASTNARGPVITLVALVVPEGEFGRAPTQPEMDAAAAAVYLASGNGVV